ncbi:imipenem/basic amino acid-specific outer membrane pore [Halopseudomonas xinjiangensis]|uniref:Imipenem/basic amino acid-specific outer membrane pore n=1 Tax=Halopseudomonas xinjiangensis TaxID=487184 RepID=A0A1H1UIY7_9GAMM|nr:OprD family outer membrane porin [Halopseudomonas xinjiangensis]SDS72524.1 imipenem/basic amino acid-specific outer membrane pore [Halopseudomonas xinjiangensis]
MKNAVKWSSIALAVAMGNGLIASQAVAQTESENQGIVEGATATLNSRTVYFNRDFRDAPGKREEAATGLLLDFQSGFSQGPIGLGFDITAMGGLKLDSGRTRTNTGLLPVDPDGKAPNEYSEIRGAVKANVLGDTVLRYGLHFPENPVIAYDDARLLPNHYHGYSVANNSIEGLFVEAGRMTDRGEMAYSDENDGAFGVEDGDVTYLGGSYTFNDALAASLYTSKAEDEWKRHFLGLSHSFDINEGLALGTEFAFYDTSDETPGAETNDNQAGSIAVTLGAGNHGFTVAYQQMGGDAGFNYYDGAIFLANSIQYGDFNAKDEKSYQARYDYDFAGLGIPGLSFMTRYVRGYDIDTDFEGAGTFIARDTRWERNSHLNYEFQSGALEGLNVLWRNATIRQDANIGGGDVDENRLIVSYSWDLL